MKRLMLLLVPVVILVSVQAWAADEFPKAEVFGGFSVATIKLDGTDRINPVGFQASVAGNLHKNFGVVADFGGQYKSENGVTGHFYEYLFGPQVSARTKKVTLFGHALFGGANIGASGNSDNGFAMGFGGGVDVKLNDRLAVRVVQADWTPMRFEGVWFKNVARFGFGIVIR